MRECIACFTPATAGAYCPEHAPVYSVESADGSLFRTRNLRRAWEAMCFYVQQGYYREASIIVPERVDLDSDGIHDAEQDLLDEWTAWEDGRIARFHLCCPPDEDTAEEARAA